MNKKNFKNLIKTSIEVFTIIRGRSPWNPTEKQILIFPNALGAIDSTIKNWV